MKLAQRLLIRYYKTKFRTLGLLSLRTAALAAVDLFCMPFDHKAPKKAPVAFHKADRLSFELGDLTIRGFRFIPSSPNGKKILVVHGFRSHAYKFEAYLTALQRLGFETYAFDAPAHGLSSGKRINAYIYKRALDEAEKRYGPFYGVIGHSLGGLAASLFVESLADHANRRLALIAPAETQRAIDNFFRIVQIDEKIRGHFTDIIKEVTGHPVSYFSVGRAVQGLQLPVLWVHDTQDTICPFADAKPVQELGLPNVTFLVTERLGHSKIYKDGTVKKEILRFFTDGIS